MQGDLRTTSLDQLCRMLEEREATGELVIVHDDETVRVHFVEGRVTRGSTSGPEMRLGDRLVHGGLIDRAALDEALDHQRRTDQPLGEALVELGMASRHVVRVFMQEQILDATFASLRWTTGAWEFVATDIADTSPSVPSDLTVPQLLYALESRHRRWNEITRSIPDLTAVPEFVPGADRSAAHLEAGEASVVDGIDGQRSLEEIAADLGFGPYEVATVVHGLAVLGLVRLREEPEPVTQVAVATPAAAPTVPDGPGGEDEGRENEGADLETLALQLADLDDFGGVDAPSDQPADETADEAPMVAIADPDEDDDAPVAAVATPAVAEADEEDTRLEIAMDDFDDLAPPPPTVMPTSNDAASEDFAPWSFTIEGDGTEPESPAPRRAVADPIRAAVQSDTRTGTPLPTSEPGPSLPPSVPDVASSADEPAAATSVDEAAEDSPAEGRDKADLLRELRQLSGE